MFPIYAYMAKLAWERHYTDLLPVSMAQKNNFTVALDFKDDLREQSRAVQWAVEHMNPSSTHRTPTNALICCHWSFISRAVASLGTAFEAMQISDLSGDPELSKKEYYSFFLRNMPGSGGCSLDINLISLYGIKRLTMYYLDNTLGQELARSLSDCITNNGLKVELFRAPLPELPAVGDPNYNSVLSIWRTRIEQNNNQRADKYIYAYLDTSYRAFMDLMIERGLVGDAYFYRFLSSQMIQDTDPTLWSDAVAGQFAGSLVTDITYQGDGYQRLLTFWSTLSAADFPEPFNCWLYGGCVREATTCDTSGTYPDAATCEGAWGTFQPASCATGCEFTSEICDAGLTDPTSCAAAGGDFHQFGVAGYAQFFGKITNPSQLFNAGVDPDPYSGQSARAFDAAMTVLAATNELLSEGRAMADIRGTVLFNRIANNSFSFTGVSGPVSYSETTGDRNEPARLSAYNIRRGVPGNRVIAGDISPLGVPLFNLTAWTFYDGSSTPPASAPPECGAGFYADVEWTCQPCPAGTYQDETGEELLESCKECPVGTYSDTAGSTSCTACGVGFSAGVGSTKCDECTPGTFAGSEQSSMCQECPEGTFASESQSSICASCPPGTHAPETGSSSCTVCPAGTAQSSTGSASCVACSAGYFSNTTGLSECLRCSVGSYQEEYGQTGCLECGTNFTTSVEASANATRDCICERDYYFIPKDGICVMCGEGCVNPSGQKDSPPLVAAGYYAAPVDSETYAERFEALSVYECVSATACPGERKSGECAEDFEGHFCDRCTGERYWSGTMGKCMDCGGRTWTVIIFAVLAFLTLAIAPLIAYWKLNGPPRRRAASYASFLSVCGMVLTFLQSAALFTPYFATTGSKDAEETAESENTSGSVTETETIASSAEGQSLMRRTLNELSVLLFNFDFLRLECIDTAWSEEPYMAEYLIRILLPVMVVLILATCYGISHLIASIVRERRRRRATATMGAGTVTRHTRHPRAHHQEEHQEADEGTVVEGDQAAQGEGEGGENQVATRPKKEFQPMDFNMVLNTYGYLFSAFFISVTHSSLELFICKEHPNGRFFLVSDPSFFCYETTWWTLFPVAIVSTLIYAVALLAVCAVVVWQAPRLYPTIPDFRIRYNFMVSFSRFRPDRWWYQLATRFRGLLLVLCLVVTRQQHLQVAFLFIVCLFSLILLCVYWPWPQKMHNWLEVILLSGLLCICLYAMTQLPVEDLPDTEMMVWTFAVLLVVMAACCLAYFQAVRQFFAMRRPGYGELKVITIAKLFNDYVSHAACLDEASLERFIWNLNAMDRHMLLDALRLISVEALNTGSLKRLCWIRREDSSTPLSLAAQNTIGGAIKHHRDFVAKRVLTERRSRGRSGNEPPPEWDENQMNTFSPEKAKSMRSFRGASSLSLSNLEKEVERESSDRDYEDEGDGYSDQGEENGRVYGPRGIRSIFGLPPGQTPSPPPAPPAAASSLRYRVNSRQGSRVAEDTYTHGAAVTKSAVKDHGAPHQGGRNRHVGFAPGKSSQSEGWGGASDLGDAGNDDYSPAKSLKPQANNFSGISFGIANVRPAARQMPNPARPSRQSMDEPEWEQTGYQRDSFSSPPPRGSAAGPSRPPVYPPSSEATADTVPRHLRVPRPIDMEEGTGGRTYAIAQSGVDSGWETLGASTPLRPPPPSTLPAAPPRPAAGRARSHRWPSAEQGGAAAVDRPAGMDEGASDLEDFERQMDEMEEQD
uniref:Tyrosine-protein kinase ephrin type A/B receptor-like domain-containing protein n=1 Tax=Chromera velia CCMP2878 TaxID=1169474 RepID=A0A0G4F6E7_9ALVE|eukprot:Cvel_2779.t1-p1 / transcript=Cvel_2779.t1 / gene=Cvel_2779 / organism=Chromera_velia_CCMP2878 / gene_product=Signal peptide, CUB and EGF-like domain-containing, putative / transcript_product=Signal peptide, CUB and EGF-like domain-containing, putative / location=Cvel_scaffold111:118128-133384(-) / protein_length=1723 / sequence_SO=supercontig / SO=protein_coding / is_pseudo=false